MELSKNKKIIIISAAILLILVGLLIASFFIRLTIENRFPPGTNVANISLSYETSKGALNSLNRASEKYLNTPIKFSLEGVTKEILPKDLGIEFQNEKTIKALQKSRKNSFPLIRWIIPAQKDIVHLKPELTINYSILLQEIDKKFNLSKKAPVSANFYFEGNVLKISEDKKGFVVDTENLLSTIKNSAETFEIPKIKLTGQEKGPKITALNLEAKKSEVEAGLNHQIALIDPIYSDDWYLKMKDHPDWVRFVPQQKVKFKGIEEEIVLEGSLVEAFDATEKSQTIAIKIDQDRLNEFIDAEIAKWLDVKPEDVNIYYDENEKIVIEGFGNDGKKIEREALREAMELAIADRVKEVNIPVETISPKITIDEKLQELGIKERLAIGHSSYYGSPANRTHNIKVGSSKINGALVAPDEIFSFNKTLGQVDGTTGYRKELVIKKEGTIPEYGGGICQVSTTAYRGFLLAGLPIEERHEHSYAVSYYSQVMGHGLDATIYLGGADLKFKNDTGGHLLIQMYTKNDYELYIVIYGTNDGRTVELEGPYLSNYHSPGPTVYIDDPSLPAGTTKQVEKAHTGFNALWYRYITRPDGKVETESITTNYKAVPNKILRGPAASTEEISG